MAPTGGVRETRLPLEQRFERLRAEDFPMAYTTEDFKRDYLKEHLPRLTPQQRREALEALSAEGRLAVLCAEQIRQDLERLSAQRPTARKPRRKK